MVKLWREDLGKVNQKAAEALADPAQYKNLFPNMDAALQAEQHQVRLQSCCILGLGTGSFLLPTNIRAKA